MATIIGIDPGITGALARISQSGCAYLYDMPIMAKGKGSSKVKNQINAAELSDILEGWQPHIVYVERISAMPGQGVSSMFSMGDSFGVIRGVCAALRIPIEFITPRQWKKYFGLPSDKEICRAKAIELYPRLNGLGKKKDHNKAEALLIARYGYEIHNEQIDIRVKLKRDNAGIA